MQAPRPRTRPQRRRAGCEATVPEREEAGRTGGRARNTKERRGQAEGDTARGGEQRGARRPEGGELRAGIYREWRHPRRQRRATFCQVPIPAQGVDGSLAESWRNRSQSTF